VEKVVKYIKDSIDEFKRIQWPTREETIRLTGYVIGASLVVGLFVAVFDYAFTEMLNYLIIN
jgi:preprotein translocase subunit SecE